MHPRKKYVSVARDAMEIYYHVVGIYADLYRLLNGSHNLIVEPCVYGNEAWVTWELCSSHSWSRTQSDT